MVIDFHIHYIPEKYVKPFLGADGAAPVVTFNAEGKVKDTYHSLKYDLPKFIEVMKIGGVDMAVLTCGLGMRADIDDCRYINDDIREQVEKYPGYFKGVAHAPSLDGKESYKELKRCRDELGFKGVVMHSIVQGVQVDSPKFYPFYEAVEELGMFLIIHPCNADFAPDFDYDLARSMWREGHLAVTTALLIEGGILDRFPNLKIVMSHLGGHFYPVISRMELYRDKEHWGTKDHTRHSKTSKMPFRWYLDKMWFDTGGIRGFINPVKMALMEIKPQNILYGTDFPIEIKEGNTIKTLVDDIRALPLPQSDIDDILGNNALRLLGMM